MMLHTYTPIIIVPSKYQGPTPYGFQDVAWTRFLKVNVTTARTKVKSMSQHDIAHLHLSVPDLV